MKTWLVKGAAVLATAAIGAGVGLVLPPPPANSAPADGPAQAWIDYPIDGATKPLQPLTVTAHAYDPGRLASLTLWVDNELIETTPVEQVVLAYTSWTWTPPADGIYVLEVRGTGIGGGQGVAGHATVIIGTGPARQQPTTTTIPGSTTTTLVGSTTPTTSSSSTTSSPPPTTAPTTVPPTTAPPTTTTPTTTPTTAPTTTPPCTPPPPVQLSPSDGAAFIGPAPAITLDWTGWRGTPPSCEPSGFYAELARSPGARPIASEHFGSEVTEWTPSRTLWSCNADHYWRVYSKRSDGSLGAVSAIWLIRVNCIG